MVWWGERGGVGWWWLGGGGGKGQVVVYTTQAKYKPLHVKKDSIPPTGVCQIFNSLTVIVMEQKLTENYLSWNLTCIIFTKN